MIKVNSTNFDLNNKMYLATQQCGGGLKEARVFSGVLGLHSNALKEWWQEMATNMGLKILSIGKDIIEENI
jgi:hypothetical protein